MALNRFNISRPDGNGNQTVFNTARSVEEFLRKYPEFNNKDYIIRML